MIQDGRIGISSFLRANVTVPVVRVDPDGLRQLLYPPGKTAEEIKMEEKTKKILEEMRSRGEEFLRKHGVVVEE